VSLKFLNLIQMWPISIPLHSSILTPLCFRELGREEEAAVWGRRANIAATALREASGGDLDEMVVVEMPETEDQ